MATNTKEQLKTLVATNKLSSELMDNIIDTLVTEAGMIEYVDSKTIWVNEGTDKVLYADDTETVELERIQDDGVKSYNGARIPGNLDLASFTYQFWEWKSIATKKTNSQETVILNGYLVIGGVIRSLNDTGYVAYSSMNDAQIVNRRSTAASTAEDEQMTVSDPLPIV